MCIRKIFRASEKPSVIQKASPLSSWASDGHKRYHSWQTKSVPGFSTTWEHGQLFLAGCFCLKISFIAPLQLQLPSTLCVTKAPKHFPKLRWSIPIDKSVCSPVIPVSTITHDVVHVCSGNVHWCVIPSFPQTFLCIKWDSNGVSFAHMQQVWLQYDRYDVLFQLDLLDAQRPCLQEMLHTNSWQQQYNSWKQRNKMKKHKFKKLKNSNKFSRP